MKKVLKVCLIISGCLILFGGAFLGVTYAVKGTEIFREVEKATEGHVNLGYDMKWNDTDWKEEAGKQLEQDEMAARADEVTELKVNFGAGYLNIVDSEDEYFHVNTDTEYEHKYGVKDGTFYFESDTDNIQMKGNRNYVQIAVPKEAKLKSAELNLGACDCDIDALRVEGEVEISIGAGSVEIGTVEAKDFQGEVGVGEMTVKNLSTTDADISVGMGNVEVEGLVTKDLKLDCGMGNAAMLVKDSEKNHNYQLSCSFGDITLGGKSMGNISGNQDINNHADSNYEISCSMGNVEIAFVENF